MIKQASLCLIGFFMLFLFTPIYAGGEKLFLIAPACLVKNLARDTSYKTHASSSSLLLLEINHAELENFIEAKQKKLPVACGGFMDVTDIWQKEKLSAKSFLKKYSIPSVKPASLSNPYSIRYPDQVRQVFNFLNPQEIWSDLTAFSDVKQFPDRYPNSNSGVYAATWLQNKIRELALSNHRNDLDIYTIPTGIRYRQPSVVVKIGDSNLGGIVIGAHMDTLRAKLLPLPGADDDGSGSMTLVALARTLLASGMHFKKPIYLIWYAAEEEGLVGSRFVVQDFANRKIPIDAVLQLDMTGYAYQNESTLWLMTDYVDSDLTNFLAQLITAYLNIPEAKKPFDYTQCGYACSDHASWAKKFRVAFPTEAKFNLDNPNIHKPEDTTQHLSLSHMTNFAKLALAFAVELAEPMAIE